MSLKKLFTLVTLVLLFSRNTSGQANASPSGNGNASSRNEAIPVNHFTGIPSISVPIFNYSNQNDLRIGISLNYFAGGVKVNDVPSSAGLGWDLNVGGIITRVVRGMPDDCAQGFLHGSQIPEDPRSDIEKYNEECLDAEQDVFQYNFEGKSGKFYIGKDSSIITVPLTKMRITAMRRTFSDGFFVEENDLEEKPPYANTLGTLLSFVITTETGTKYLFEERETNKIRINNCIPFSNYPILKYATAWHLSKIISQSGKDSITISYKNLSQGQPTYRVQSATIINGIISHSDTSEMYSGIINANNKYSKVPVEIQLPNSKKVQFYYSSQGQFRHTFNPLLQRIKVFDTAFINGFILNWDTTSLGTNSRNFLRGIDFYTTTAIKKGFEFNYNAPYFKVYNVDSVPNIDNKKDHWGYYNGANNSKDFVPTVPGLYSGANREPNALAIASSLASVKDPNGGITYYDFENNDTYPYQSIKQVVNNINIAAVFQQPISISRIVGSQTYFKIKLNMDNSILNSGAIGGPGNLVIKITDLSGSNILSTNIISLKNLYYLGIASFVITVPTGSYLLKTELQVGTTCTQVLPSQFTWHNQVASTGNAELVGGIRIKQIRHYDPFTNKTDTTSTYKYVLESGKSSGFLATKPVYDYIFYSNTPSNKHVILSNVINEFDYSEGSPIGYSRVEIIKGTQFKNLGKQVIEFSTITDFGYDVSPAEFPYIPRIRKDWAWGLPKKIMLYDNAGKLVQTTKNTFSFSTINLSGNNNFKSLKIGQYSDVYGVNNYLENYKNYFAEGYYPEAGRADLVASVDTFYHPNNSITTSWKTFVTDTNYNVTKITTPFDVNKNLNLEKRIYYPYNYTISGIVATMRDSSIFMPVSTESWIIGDGNNRMLAAEITDFQKPLFSIIKPTTVYSLVSNKPVLQNVIGLFDPSVLIRNTSLLKPQQTNFYDRRGRLLQSTNSVSGRNNSIIYTNNYNNIIAKVSNAQTSEIAYTSFEQNADGYWAKTGYIGYDSTTAITGRFSADITNAQITRTGLDAAKVYNLTYWTKGNIYLSNSNTYPPITEHRNGWNLYTHKVTGVTEISVMGSGLIDELRLFPSNANMETSCYDSLGNVVSTNDANNNIQYFEYDKINRLKILRNKDYNIVKKYEYSDNYVEVNFAPNWQSLGSLNWRCEKDTLGNNTGNVLREEEDINPFSEGYKTTRIVFDHFDITRCPYVVLQCGGLPWKSINGICEAGVKITTASVYKKVLLTGTNTLGFAWVCTYHYLWSDGSVSANFTEQSYNSCPITTPDPQI
jgi:hypothetical protein